MAEKKQATKDNSGLIEADEQRGQPSNTPGTNQKKDPNDPFAHGAPEVTSKGGGLKVYAVRNEGYDTRGESIVAAGSPGEAIEHVWRKLAEFELVHANGQLRARELDKDEYDAKPSSAGVVKLYRGEQRLVQIDKDQAQRDLDAYKDAEKRRDEAVDERETLARSLQRAATALRTGS
jgi:hypothetical protein